MRLKTLPARVPHAVQATQTAEVRATAAVTSTIESGRYHWVVNVVNGNSYFNLIPTNGPRLDQFHAAVNVQFIQGNDDGQSAYG